MSHSREPKTQLLLATTVGQELRRTPTPQDREGTTALIQKRGGRHRLDHLQPEELGRRRRQP
jgi:hypothetical protein